MSQVAFEKPVEDSVSKIEEVAVGEDLEFQRRWWRFEHIAWATFTIIIILTLAGVFGRGPLAKARAGNSAMRLEYERVERTNTPSMLRVSFQPSSIHNGQIQLFVSESVVNQLGAQRIIPAPLTSAVGNGGITYTFPATESPATVAFALQPAAPSVGNFTVQTPGDGPITRRVIVMP